MEVSLSAFQSVQLLLTPLASFQTVQHYNSTKTTNLCCSEDIANVLLLRWVHTTWLFSLADKTPRSGPDQLALTHHCVWTHNCSQSQCRTQDEVRWSIKVETCRKENNISKRGRRSHNPHRCPQTLLNLFSFSMPTWKFIIHHFHTSISIVLCVFSWASILWEAH